jgi:ElaB/YqjD/DUF883 family membrane-anchored ribosome-binding protein
MDQDRNQIREVEDARERVAQDVRSVAENANVVERTKETVRGKVNDAKDTVSDTVQGARDRLTSARDSLQSSVQDMGSSVRENIGNTNLMENPIAMLVGGLAVGFLIGLVLPVTRFEAERIGPIADDMKGRVRDAGTEVVRRGGEVIKETIDASRQAATNAVREQMNDMGSGGTNGSG